MKTLALALLLPALISAQVQPNAASKPAPGQSAAAPAVDPALAADIRRLLDDAGVMQLIRQQVDQMMQPTIALMKQNPNLSPQFVDETMRRTREKLVGSDVEEMAIEAYAKFFTRDDIQQMIAYQESPVGRKARQVSPQMLAELGAKVQAFGERVGREAAAQVIQEHPEYVKQAQSSTSTPPPPSGGVVGGILGSVSTPSQFTGPHLDEQSAESRLIRRVKPVYPPLAKAASIQGSVHFTVIVGKDGVD